MGRTAVLFTVVVFMMIFGQRTGRTVVEDGHGVPAVVADDVDGEAVEVGGPRSHRQQVVRHEVLRRRIVNSEVRNTALLRPSQHRLNVGADYCRHVRRTDLHVRWFAAVTIRTRNLHTTYLLFL